MAEKRFQELGITVPFPQRDVNLTSTTPLKFEWTDSPEPPRKPAP